MNSYLPPLNPETLAALGIQNGQPPPAPAPQPTQSQALAAMGVPANPAPPAAQQSAPAPTPEAAGFAQPAGAAGSPNPATMAMPAPQVIPAHSVSFVSPEQRKAIEQAQTEQRYAQQAVGPALMGQNQAEQGALQQQAGVLGQQDAAMQAKEAARQKAYAAQEAEYKQLQAQADQGKIDPEQWEKSRNGGQKFTDMLSVLLGGLAMGRNGVGENVGLEMIKRKIDQNIGAQRENIEGKRKSADAARNSLDQMRARFGDDRTAEAAERAKQFEQYKTLAQVEASRAQSPVIAAGLKKAAADLDMEQAKEHGTMEHWQPATVAPGGATPQAVNNLAQELLKSGRYRNPDDANNAAMRLLTRGRGGTNQDSVAAGKGNFRLALRQADLDEAEQAAMRLQGLLKRGSSLSMDDRARATADAATMRRHGFTSVPENPLELLSSSGARSAGVDEDLRSIRSARASLARNAGGGGGGEEPEGDPDEGITPAGK